MLTGVLAGAGYAVVVLAGPALAYRTATAHYDVRALRWAMRRSRV
jgi:hypothetical protein